MEFESRPNEAGKAAAGKAFELTLLNKPGLFTL
jgi:hypothetical protein